LFEEIYVEVDKITEFYRNNFINYPDNYEKVFPNNGIILRNYENSSTAIGRYNSTDNTIVALNATESIYGYKPKNKEQSLIWDAMQNDNIKMVVIEGGAATGKTFVSLLFGTHGVETKKYENIIVTRGTYEAGGKAMGFLPGDINQKFDPYLGGFYDNIRQIWKTSKSSRRDKDPKNIKFDAIDYFYEKGWLQSQPLQFIRGRTIANSFFIVDEAQNLDGDDIKTILTRMCDSTKIVILGDNSVGQRDRKNIKMTALDHLRLGLQKNELDFIQFIKMDDQKTYRGKVASAAVQYLPVMEMDKNGSYVYI
jgi:PhoH-like ATPase